MYVCVTKMYKIHIGLSEVSSKGYGQQCQNGSPSVNVVVAVNLPVMVNIIF